MFFSFLPGFLLASFSSYDGCRRFVETFSFLLKNKFRIFIFSLLSLQVPGRPSAAELKAMALRQQQQIDSQHQLLAAKEQRLRFLKAQEARGAAAAAEGERLRRLRERVEAQESKLRRLRALRGQVDLQKTYNATLSE